MVCMTDEEKFNLKQSILNLQERIDVLENKVFKRHKIASEVSPISYLFKELWGKKYNSPYPTWSAKEAGQIKRWYHSVGKDKAESLVIAYFSWNDPFVVKAGHPLGLLITQTPRLVSDLTSSTKKLKEIKAHEIFVKEEKEETAYERGLRIAKQLTGNANHNHNVPSREVHRESSRELPEESSGLDYLEHDDQSGDQDAIWD